MKNRLPTISIKNTATDDSSMIITVMHFSGILFVKVLINNAPNISAHWKGNNERQGKAITFNTTIKVRVIYISAYHGLTYFVFFVQHNILCFVIQYCNLTTIDQSIRFIPFSSMYFTGCFPFLSMNFIGLAAHHKYGLIS